MPSQLRDRSADPLGPVVRTWRPKTTGIFNSVDLANGCIGVIGAWLLIGLAWAGLYTILGSRSPLQNAVAIVAGVLAVLTFVAWIRWARGFSKVAVDQHAGGLVVTRRDKRFVIPWDDISGFRWVAVSTRGAAALGSSVRTIGGTSVDLPSLIAGSVELGQLIEREVYARKMPGAMDAFRRGETLVFGTFPGQEVGLSNRQITLGKKSFAWADVLKVSIERGVEPSLTVTWAGARFQNQTKVGLSRVDNVAVLLGVVGTITNVAVG